MAHSIFQLIDLDRTIFDTSGFIKAITDEINLTEPGVGTELDTRYEAAYKKEETFFLLRYLREERGDEWFEELVKRVVEKIGAPALLLTGVRERLSLADAVTDYRPSWGVMTFGDKVDQLMKLLIVGLQDAPILLTDTPDKAGLMRSWQQPDGTFQLPLEFGGGVVDYLTLEDDKLRAFVGLPEGAHGFWVTQDEEEIARQRLVELGEVATSVTIVKNLSDVAQTLRISA